MRDTEMTTAMMETSTIFFLFREGTVAKAFIPLASRFFSYLSMTMRAGTRM